MSLPLLTGLAVVLAMAAAAGALLPAAPRGRLARRARAFAPRASAGPNEAGSLLKGARDTRLDSLARRFLPRPEALRARLEATGKPITIGHYGAACLVVGALDAGGAMTFGAPPFFALLSGLAAGAWLPHTAAGFLIGRRRAKFFKVFAEAIGLIVRGLRAGLPVTETIAVVGREIADPVGEEFRHISDQVRLGQPVETAMWQVARRLSLPEFNFLVISLSVQRETGGNLAETLENLENILRRRQQMRLKIKAMASEATASALIIGSLPFIMAILMWVVGRDYMRALFVEPLGRMMLAGAVASLTIGGVVMRKMVRFEI
jgi:tight adherence protein B